MFFSRLRPAYDAGAPAAAPAAPSSPQSSPSDVPASGSAPADAGLAKAAADGTLKAVPGNPDMIAYTTVGGKRVEISRHEAARKLSLVDGSQARFQEGAEMAKNAREREKLFSENPYKYYRSIGKTHDEARTILENQAVEAMRIDAMSPEQKEIARLNEENQKWISEKETRERAEMSAREQQQMDSRLADWEHQMTTALSATPKLSNDPLFKIWATDLIKSSVSTGLELSPAEAMKEVEYRFLDQVKKTVSGWDAKMFKSVFGPEVISKLRSDDMSEIKTAEAPFAKTVSSARGTAPLSPNARRNAPVPSQSAPAADQPKSRSEFFDSLRGHNFKKK